MTNSVVVRVVDGDTVIVRHPDGTEHRTRLAGIDAPESRQQDGAASSQHLRRLIEGRDVRTDVVKIDAYGRDLATIYRIGRNGRAIDTSREQLDAGMAWFYKRYQRDLKPEQREVYRAAELQARTAGRGLWADPQARSPWEWRGGKP